MALLSAITSEEIESARRAIAILRAVPTVQGAAQEFAALLKRTYSTVVLARVYAVVAFSALPAADLAKARRAVGEGPRLEPTTRVLSLLGTSGREKEWNDRDRSRAHLAIPLVDRQFVENAPMIASLLPALGVDLDHIETASPIASRPTLGGKNNVFFVPDARTAVDGRGRRIIDRSFVERYELRTVFGVGSAYDDGVLALAIVFSSEPLDRAVVDRFPRLIKSFVMATAETAVANRFYER